MKIHRWRDGDFSEECGVGWEEGDGVLKRWGSGAEMGMREEGDEGVGFILGFEVEEIFEADVGG